MLRTKEEINLDANAQETREWLEALDEVIDLAGPDRVKALLQELVDRAYLLGVSSPVKPSTPYVNTIPVEEEVPYPGDLAMERRIRSLIRWNAAAMVVRANKYDDGIGGHISTFASLATLSEV
ncbi:MAG TPA: pyruvate dehydrogenase (acetyl-transferring), homodimeric type, partial [Bryobacteraceae bacterium]|nr:pyruvate dehydrogenase (acetyl-transferring), homodimeric type [Bryobacteraceae bacterium]